MTNAMDAPPSETTDTDRIVLTLPGAPELRSVASLVLGGIGSRLDLPYEQVDELQLAVLSVLGACDVESATIEVEIADAPVAVTVDPLLSGTTSAPGLRTVLERLVDGVEPAQRATGDDAEWIALRLVRRPAAAT
jgi:hypothetical protein